jgi:hypothetical protein
MTWLSCHKRPKTINYYSISVEKGQEILWRYKSTGIKDISNYRVLRKNNLFIEGNSGSECGSGKVPQQTKNQYRRLQGFFFDSISVQGY